VIRLVKWAAVLGVAVFVALQLVPYGHAHHNPAVAADAPWPTPHARQLAVAACYDCHSNETTWPWYSKVAPMSWLVQRDVDNGRRRLNFSAWGQRQAPEHLDEVVANGTMPPKQYTLLHPDARLTAADKAELTAALKQLRGDGGRGDGGGGRGRGRGGPGGG
jgi:hypothetical protein